MRSWSNLPTCQPQHLPITYGQLENLKSICSPVPCVKCPRCKFSALEQISCSSAWGPSQGMLRKVEVIKFKPISITSCINKNNVGKTMYCRMYYLNDGFSLYMDFRTMDHIYSKILNWFLYKGPKTSSRDCPNWINRQSISGGVLHLWAVTSSQGSIGISTWCELRAGLVGWWLLKLQTTCCQQKRKDI